MTDDVELESLYEDIGRILDAAGNNFSDLVANSGLEPDTDFRGADMRGLNLAGVDFTRFDLSGANLSKADLSGANLCGARLKAANLSDAKLERARLRGADLRDANLAGSVLAYADLLGADLQSVSLRDADLTDALLDSSSVLGQADLLGAKLDRVKFSETMQHFFSVDDYIVYPSHGVGRIIAIETQEIVGEMLEMYVVSFEQDRVILRVPIAKALRSGMSKLGSGARGRERIEAAMNALKARPRPRRAVMWSRRAQEYEAKINSGDPVSIAEVVRELHPGEDAEQSYSERQMYRDAVERLAREVAAIERIDDESAREKVRAALAA